MFGDKIQKWKNGEQTRRCRAVTIDGPCRNWTYFEYCHAHEWKTTEIVMGVRQTYVTRWPWVMERLFRVIDEPDSEVALKGIVTYAAIGEKLKLLPDGLAQATNGLADLTVDELVERAQRAIAVLQQPQPPEGGLATAALGGSENGLSGPSDAAPPAGSTAAPPAGGASETAFSGLSEPLS
jgi:hypothetical protein